MAESQIPILMYHALEAIRSPITISPSDFEFQMRWLYENEVQVIPLQTVVERLENGQSLPERAVVLTFDDGFEDVFTAAFPILSKYGYPATVFLVSGYIGRDNRWPGQPEGIPQLPLLSWDQISEMDRHGLDFGAHTVSHPHLNDLTVEKVEYEISTSKEVIEQRLGRPVNVFSYPYGEYNRQVKEVAGVTFTGACTIALGLVSSTSDPLELERIHIGYFNHRVIFPRLFGRFRSTYLGLLRNARATRRAIMSKSQ